ncbi:G-protein gamma-like subunit [Natronobacterium gregoryi SP2]|nr:G-protein gamma-like subunit [Natronobacterium gregoryi SP2]
MTAGITAPLTALGAASISTASDVEEMGARFEEVFESSAESVEEWADTHADEIGRSQNQLQEYAANFGSLLSAMDATEEQTAEMSKELTTLTADLASFNNMTEDQVQQNLEAALAGQSRAVRKFGVDLSAARVEQQLMNDGLAESREEASEAELAQARLNAILEQTEDAQGDAARTSDSFANQMRSLRADTEELRAEIGQHLLPAATSLVGWASRAVGWFSELSDTQQKAIVITGGLAAALGPLLLAGGTLLAMLPSMAAGWGMATAAATGFAGSLAGGVVPAALAANVALGPITVPLWAIVAAIGAVIAAVGGLYYAFSNNLWGIRDTTMNVFSTVQGWLDRVPNGLLALLGPVGMLYEVWRNNLFGVQDVVGNVFDWIGDKIDWLRDQIERIPGLGDDDEFDQTDAIDDPEDPEPPEPTEEFEEAGENTAQSFGSGFQDGLVEQLETGDVEDHLSEGIEAQTDDVAEMEARMSELETIEERGIISDEAQQELDTLRSELPDARDELANLEDQLADVQEADDITEIESEVVADVAEAELQSEREEAEALKDVYDELENRDIDVESDIDPERFDEVDVGSQVDDVMADGDDSEPEEKVEEKLTEEMRRLRELFDELRIPVMVSVDEREFERVFETYADDIVFEGA